MLTRSRNNHMFGTVVQWLFDTLAGYKPLKPGYEEIEYRPMVPANGLDWVRASTDTVRGTVATEWRKVRRGFNLDLEVPANATGSSTSPRIARGTSSRLEPAASAARTLPRRARRPRGRPRRLPRRLRQLQVPRSEVRRLKPWIVRGLQNPCHQACFEPYS